jgi:hypothetical protein
MDRDGSEDERRECKEYWSSAREITDDVTIPMTFCLLAVQTAMLLFTNFIMHLHSIPKVLALFIDGPDKSRGALLASEQNPHAATRRWLRSASAASLRFHESPLFGSESFKCLSLILTFAATRLVAFLERSIGLLE